MPRTSFNALTKKRASTRKRRTSVATKAKYQAPTARNQKRQILGNALDIRALKRLIGPPVYTDWIYGGELDSRVPDNSYSQTIAQAQLMSPVQWGACLRQDVNVIESSTTVVKRMQINLRYNLRSSNWAQFTTFVVSIRKDAADRIINQTGLTEGPDYINSLAQDFNVRLNPAVFKVHYVSNKSLTNNSWLAPTFNPQGQILAGNPNTTWSKGQVNMNLNFRLRQPSQGLSWTAMDQSMLGPSQRLFLISFIVQQSDTPGSLSGANVTFDSLYTCYNTS